VVLQFLREQGLPQSAETLQQESGIYLNSVRSPHKTLCAIRRGDWRTVLPDLQSLQIPSELSTQIYEQIAVDLAEQGDSAAMSDLCSWFPALKSMTRIKRLLDLDEFDAEVAYPGGGSREARLETLASRLELCLENPPAARLLALISKALKWDKHIGNLPKGSSMDLLTGEVSGGMGVEKEDVPVLKISKSISFGTASEADIVSFSENGEWLVSGSSDGFIEVWDWDTGALRTDLAYQNADELMSHTCGVLSLAFSNDSELLASGDENGVIKIWKLSSGKCLRKLSAGHSRGITSLMFSSEGLQLLAASFEDTVKIHGLKSGSTLKEFREDGSFLVGAVWICEDSEVITCSSNGSLKSWNVSTGYSERNLSLYSKDGDEVQSLRIMGEKIIILGRDRLFVVSETLSVLQTVPVSKTRSSLTSVSPSAFSKLFYFGSEEGKIYILDSEDGALVRILEAHSKSVKGIAHHPHRNLLASWSSDGLIRLWTP